MFWSGTSCYIGHWGVMIPRFIVPFWIFSGSNFVTPWCMGPWGVMTLWCIGPRGVMTLQYIGHWGVAGSFFKIQITISPRPSWFKMRKNFCGILKFMLISTFKLSIWNYHRLWTAMLPMSPKICKNIKLIASKLRPNWSKMQKNFHRMKKFVVISINELLKFVHVVDNYMP